MYNSPVYLCLLDASKAFDKLNHWHLFSKLIDRKLPCIIVRILFALYRCQRFVVQWCGIMSEPFFASNGAPQGRILSPCFFNLYMDELSIKLNNSNTGCHINDICVNHMFYADDSVLIAPTPRAIQKLLDICSEYANTYELRYNAKKTECMIFKPKWLNMLSTPSLKLCNVTLQFSEVKKYLGCIIANNLSDDCDIKRQIRSVYARGNSLIKKFRHCSEEVKVKLFKSYCSSFYGCTLWAKFYDYNINKLVVAYKQIFRAFFKRERKDTSRQMLDINIDSYGVILRKLVYGFRTRVFSSNNIVVAIIANSVFFRSSHIFKHWTKVLFNL